MSLTAPQQPGNYNFIRGVNIGGWLVMERYITPYSFAVTDCHQRGDFCWYPDQIDAPSGSNVKMCNITECEAVLGTNAFGQTDYPLDEWHLNAAFSDNQTIGEQWLNSHFDNFVQKEDLVQLKKAGITHIRVPLPHWILGDIDSDYEPYIAADRWKYFLRLCDWARDVGLEIWPNLHTAPGSQNGFDNSGKQNSVKTCGAWNDNPSNIQRTLDILLEIAVGLKEADVLDVVTGFGLLNEPFGDCKKFVYQKFLESGIRIIRDTLGEGVSIYMSDLFQAPLFNDGIWGLDVNKFNNTFLDSHYYNVFTPASRTMTPQEHVSGVCHATRGQKVTDCCFEDAPDNTIPSQGVQRIVAEWSGAFDAMPGEVLKAVMKGIFEYGKAPLLDRTLSEDRKSFLTKFIESQIVTYEVADVGVAHGWFYWNFKMEGGAFAEWDFLRGVREGWFPEIAPPNVASESLYGTCDEILQRTNETVEIIHTYPWGDPAYWRGPRLVNQSDTIKAPHQESTKVQPEHHFVSGLGSQIAIIGVAILLFLGYRAVQAHGNQRRKWQYQEIQT